MVVGVKSNLSNLDSDTHWTMPLLFLFSTLSLFRGVGVFESYESYMSHSHMIACYQTLPPNFHKHFLYTLKTSVL